MQPSWEVMPIKAGSSIVSHWDECGGNLLGSVNMYVSAGDQGNKMEDFLRSRVLLRRHPHRLMQVTRVREILRMVLGGSWVQSKALDLVQEL